MCFAQSDQPHGLRDPGPGQYYNPIDTLRTPSRAALPFQVVQLTLVMIKDGRYETVSKGKNIGGRNMIILFTGPYKLHRLQKIDTGPQ